MVHKRIDPDPNCTPAAERLSACKPRVLETWEKKVRADVGEANFHTRKALFDSFPAFIDGIVERLKAPNVGFKPWKETKTAIDHGDQRANLEGYSLDEVIYEYNILRKVMLEILEEKEPLTFRDRDEILNSIFFALEKAACEFMRNKDGKRDAIEGSLRHSHAELGKEVKAQAMRIEQVTGERDQSTERTLTLEGEKALRETFVDTLTHDLRAPLTTIKLTAQMLARNPERLTENPGLIARILDAIERVDRMIQDLLDTSSVRAGQKLPLRKQEMDLVKLTREVCEEMSSVHGQQFRVEAKGAVSGYWDPNGLRRILENLMKNAYKYGAPQSPITTRVSEDGDFARLEVHNTGNPVPLEDQGKLFRPFQRAHAAQASGQSGWGLGLTLVKGMAEAHGGSVSVESSAEKGTTFSVRLPKNAS